MFGMGVGELLVVLMVVLLVFGPGRLPEMMEGHAGVQEGAQRAARA
jgi:TatA/E family protein of Tat protein translocase